MEINSGLQQLLSALGSALLNSFWQMGLLWLLVLITVKLFPRLSPSPVNTISFVALMIGFLAFVGTCLLSLMQTNDTYSILTWIHLDHFHSFTRYSGILYLALLAIPLFKLLFGIGNIYSLKNIGTTRVPGHYKLFVADMALYLGIKRKVKIMASSVAASPFTTGFLKPVILIPFSLLNQLSTQEVEAIILHELAHIKRNDFLQNIMIQVILTILYFNPFAKMLANLAQTECEKSADHWVTRFEYNHFMYAGLLLQLAQQSMIEKNKLAIQITGKQTPLLERVEWIFGQKKRQLIPVKKITFLLLVIAAALFISGNKRGSIVENPLAHSEYSPVVSISYNTVNNNKESSKATQSAATARTPKRKIVAENKSIQKTMDVKDEEPVQKEQPPRMANFVRNAIDIIPQLTPKEEENIQRVLKTSQKIMIRSNWDLIENALAETMTSADKSTIKEAYFKKMQASDWTRQANELRLRYQHINWNDVNDKLSGAIHLMLLDSLIARYNQAGSDLIVYEKRMNKDSTLTLKIQKEYLNEKMLIYLNIIKELDSLGRKKVVEL